MARARGIRWRGETAGFGLLLAITAVAITGCLVDFDPGGPSRSGNGRLDPSEACDDGNPASGDGC